MISDKETAERAANLIPLEKNDDIIELGTQASRRSAGWSQSKEVDILTGPYGDTIYRPKG